MDSVLTSHAVPLTKPGSNLPPLAKITGGREAAIEAAHTGAVAAQRAQDWAMAERLHEEVLRLQPGHLSSLSNLAITLRQQGRREEGYERLEQAFRRAPLQAELLQRMQEWSIVDGLGERYRSQLASLVAANPKALALQRALYDLLWALGAREEAIAACRGASLVLPTTPEIPLSLGRMLASMGRLVDAAAAFKTATDLKPQMASAWAGLGSVLTMTDKVQEGIALLRHAESIEPSYEARFLLGSALARTNKFQEAEQWLRGALDLQAGSRAARRRLAEVLYARSLPDEAIETISTVLEGPDGAENRFVDAAIVPIIPKSHADIDHWRNRVAERIAAIRRDKLPITSPDNAVGITNFRLAYHARDNKPIHVETAAALLDCCPSLAWAAPRRDGERDPRIRIGMVSHFFAAHTIGALNRGLLAQLDRDRFHVTICTVPGPADPLRESYRAGADRVIDIPTRLAEARQLIADADLDLLYYTDIGMSPFTYLLPFARLAPVQCVTWGHPDTTGIPNLDYFVSCDAMEPPAGTAHYSETLIRLPGPTIHMGRIEFQTLKPRAAFGLPDEAHIYICPQTLFKLHPDFDQVLGAILSGDPAGLLVLLEGKDPLHREILLVRMQRSGVDASRIRFLPQQDPIDYVNLIAVCDVMLDPLHYSGGKTSLEAFAMGTPIVTWPGEFMRGRHTYGFYKMMGIESLIVKNPVEYVHRALELGTDPQARTRASAEIVARRAVLYENVGTIRAVEEFFIAAVEAARAGSKICG